MILELKDLKADENMVCRMRVLQCVGAAQSRQGRKVSALGEQSVLGKDWLHASHRHV